MRKFFSLLTPIKLYYYKVIFVNQIYKGIKNRGAIIFLLH